MKLNLVTLGSLLMVVVIRLDFNIEFVVKIAILPIKYNVDVYVTPKKD